MRYPIAIETGDKATAFGVVFPDLPGCFSAGDTLDDAMTGAEEAARPGSTPPWMPAARSPRPQASTLSVLTLPMKAGPSA